MANQAFALSPISARASVPSEEDYDAIRDAFMETARGRWFLDEYAKRNRNADTRMVLDAVARIEETIAAQKQPPPPVVVDRLPAALSSIRGAVEKAQQAASVVFDGLQLAENLAPIRKGARIIKEISWRWREIGADGRICDLLDSQVVAIESGCEKIAAADPRTGLREAFDIIRASISAFSDIAAAAPEAVAAEARVAQQQTPPAVDQTLVMTAANAPTPDQPEPYDEAMLERVPFEMATPDLDVADAEFAMPAPVESPQGLVTERPAVQFTELPRIEPVVAASAAEPALMHELAPPPPPVAPEPAPSLGATLLATGLVTRPKAP